MNDVCFKTTENEKERKNQKPLSFFMELLKDADILIWAERIQAQLTHQNPDTLQLRQC